MPLSPGTRFGSYEVVAPLGAGGMGEVYRARDTALNRDVALKLLPEMFAADADRLARFEREAQALAALNHPNIAQVYAIERLTADNSSTRGRAIVMELVEGEDLAAQTARGPIPPNDALPIARQIALALEAAHGAGIVHRDLKPANIKIRPDGTAKVLDFGLAKAVGGDGASTSSAVANSPTLTARATELGVVLGTAAYMSPEQAKGRAVDRRTDVWAFGCVLYEMLTGRRAFGGDDVTEVMAAVIRDTPDLRALPVATPTAVRRLLRRALEKDVRKRLRDMGDVGVELDEAMSGSHIDDSGRATAGADRDGGGQQARRSPIVWIATTVVVGAVTAIAAWGLKPATPFDRPITRFSLFLDEGVSFSSLNFPNLAWSADGRRLAYRAGGALFVHDLDGASPREVLRSLGASQWFSPDGSTLLFRTSTGLSTVPIAGGPAVEIARVSEVAGADWLDDHSIVYSDQTSIFRIPSAGGTADVLVKSALGATAAYPQILPGGRSLLYTTGTKQGLAIVVKEIGSDAAPREVLAGVGGARYAPTGHLVYGVESRLMAVPFDADRVAVRGTAVPLPQGVYVGTQLIPQAVFAGNGSLAYVSAGAPARLRLSWVDSQGQSKPALPDLRTFSDLVLSPDGRRAVSHLWDEDNDIWVADLERGTLTRATHSTEEEETPVWSPDGRELAYASTRSKRVIFRKAADGGASAPEHKVFESDGHTHVNAWGRDGNLIVEIRRSNRNDLIAVNVKTGEAKDLLVTPFNQGWARLSPDGRWLAYVSNESGANQVYVQPYPAMNTRVQVSVGGGVEPVWSRDGRQIYFRTTENFMSAALASGAPLEFGTPKVLFKDRFARAQGSLHTHYDVAPDGRFLVVENPEVQKGSGRAEIHVVLNWFEELKRLVPVK